MYKYNMKVFSKSQVDYEFTVIAHDFERAYDLCATLVDDTVIHVAADEFWTLDDNISEGVIDTGGMEMKLFVVSVIPNEKWSDASGCVGVIAPNLKSAYKMVNLQGGSEYKAFSCAFAGVTDKTLPEIVFEIVG